MNTQDPSRRVKRAFPIFTILAGLIGWFASFELLTEYIAVLKNPAHIPNCNISLLVTCGPNMGSPQGSIFGFSNTIIGVAAFVAPIIVGVILLAGLKLPRWFEGLYCLGLTGGIALVTWLQVQSIFALGTLCPWCMVVWTVMIPLWWLTVLRYLSGGISDRDAKRGSKFLGELYSWAWVAIVLHFITVAAIAQVQLNWFRELNF